MAKVKSERRRPFIGDQLDECKDYSGMFYILPFNKGYLINWDVQRQIWDYLFRTKLKLPTDNKNRFSEVAILVTEPVYNFNAIRENMIELLFEDYGFGEILICSAPQLAAFQYCYQENKNPSKSNDTVFNSETNTVKASSEIACLVVDSGFSFTHVVPFVEGHKILTHAKRINVGGKVLTNHLKDIISYRQINVLDETYVVNQMKEDCCYVSMDLWTDLETARQRGSQNTILRNYILPDFNRFRRGFVFDKEKHSELLKECQQDEEPQRIIMNNERFQVPELLFHPGDVNIDQIGISHSIIDSVSEFHPNFKSHADEPVDPAAQSAAEKQPQKPSLREIDTDEDDESDMEVEEEKVEKNGDKKKKGSKSTVANGKQNGNEPENGEEEKVDELAIYQDENVQSHLYNNILLIGKFVIISNIRQTDLSIISQRWQLCHSQLCRTSLHRHSK